MKNLPFSSELPLWLIIPVILISLGISLILYYRHKSFPIYLKWILFSLRFIIVFILALLLLNPFFFNSSKVSQKPILVLAIDESESMLNDTDSIQLSTLVQNNITEIKEELSEIYEIDLIGFDHQIDENPNYRFHGKRTDIGKVLAYTSDKYYMLPLSGIVLLSDGQNNQGISPIHFSENQSSNIYPIVYGDTNAQADIYIDALFHNKVIRQNTKFPLDVIVQAKGLKGQVFQLKIEKSGQLIQQKEIEISSDNFNEEIRFELPSAGSGLQSYTVRIPELKEEKNTQNNSSSFYIQSLESGNKILILGNNAHPDLGALASALRKVDGYEVDIKTLEKYPFSISEYQLLILHGLPSLEERSKMIFENKEWKNKALWYIWSTSTDLPSLTEGNFPWMNTNSTTNFEYSEVVANEDFNSFKMPKLWTNTYQSYPPLYVPFVKWQNRSQNEVLFNQNIRGFESGEVLLGTWTKGQLKRAFLAGEGLWKWRIYDYQSSGNHENFNTLIQRISRYLLTGVYDNRFNLQYQSVYNETDLIKWEAQVYNKAFESLNNAHISLSLKNEKGTEYQYQFSPEENGYSALLGYLNAGEYSFNAEAKLSDTTLIANGRFIVKAWNMEQARSGSNMNLLDQLADISGGKSYSPSQITSLIEELKNRPDAAVRYSITQQIVNFIDLKYLALILVILLSAEWVLRKRFGTY